MAQGRALVPPWDSDRPPRHASLIILGCASLPWIPCACAIQLVQEFKSYLKRQRSEPSNEDTLHIYIIFISVLKLWPCGLVQS